MMFAQICDLRNAYTEPNEPDVKLDTRALSKLRGLFLRHAITERELAQRVSSLPVTRTLSIAHKGFLPAHCVAQLLTARLFAKHSIPIHEWLESQIVECRSPVHPTVIELINAYASSCLPADGSRAVNEPLSEKFIEGLFAGDIVDEDMLVPRLLTFFFMLSLRSKIDKLDTASAFTYPYKPNMETRLPIRYMISVMSARSDDFQALRSPMLRVAAHFYSYMLPDANSLLYSVKADLTSKLERSDSFRESEIDRFLEAISTDTTRGVLYMERLEWSSLRTQIHLRKCVLHAMRVAIKHSMPAPFVASLTYVWNRIENVETVEFLEETVNALSGERITHEMLCDQPLLLYRCKDDVFKSGPLFSCFLRLLSFYHSAGRSILAHKLQTASASSANRQDQKAEREELARSLLGAQDSEMVQVLLEACWRFSNPEVQQLACEHIHQMFIADPVLLKLVHFQGYPVVMVPMAVRLIPSMHICLDFVHEMLALADMSKRLFAIVLITELAQQETVNALSGERITHEMLCDQPLLLYRCKDDVFKSGPLFSCFLRLLSFYHSAGRSILAHKLQTASASSANRQDQKAEREELARSLLGAQDSEMVQVLLEACWRFSNPEVQQLACEHIHQMFIADPVLLKLVHFQGYPVVMVPMAVRLIPSMHICLDFVHEMLALADMSKRLFAIVLITELAQQYRIEHSCIRVDLVLDVLWTLCRVLPCEEVFPLLPGVVPALARMMTVFPQLKDDVTYVLKGISKTATARIIASATVLKPASCPERKLIAEIDRVIAKQGDNCAVHGKFVLSPAKFWRGSVNFRMIRSIMSDYFAEHSRNENISNDWLAVARMLVEGGWNEQLGLTWETMFPNSTKAACPKAVAALERLRSNELQDDGLCPVCICEWERDESVRLVRMPCGHILHERCILPWLKRTNSCPVCRHELPCEDPLYETYKKQQERRREREADLAELHDSMFS
ncbi:Integrator complex subunit 2 [Toxocara canis]|uniref:Integrator complex subunit 2 n=1 Tax=Toxocara canis TaxID=6265 RepID=A0A0B2UXW7_TOXCA|nr:Integrator complex subunit 2 [Toxocara canis]